MCFYWEARRSLEQGIEFYKYVFIDESHRFKGDSTQRYELLTRICQNKGVILVSATPYNNTLDDIYSQLKLFQPPRNSTIPGLRNLAAFFEKLRNRIKGLNRLRRCRGIISRRSNRMLESCGIACLNTSWCAAPAAKLRNSMATIEKAKDLVSPSQ